MTGTIIDDNCTETSPLLASEGTSCDATGHHERPKVTRIVENVEWTSDAIHNASLATAFLVLYAFADVLKYIATVQLIEVGVCREHFLDNDRNSASLGFHAKHEGVPQDTCKLPVVQQRLAHLRGYLAALEAIVGLLLTLPYGLIVDYLGERLVAGLNVVGYLLSCTWLLVVCFYWTTFPIWSVVIAPLFRIIGGGSPVLASVIYAIAVKHVPNANRSLCFFFFMAAQLLSEIVAVMVAASLLDHSYLFMPIIVNFPVGLLCLLTLVMMRSSNDAILPTDPQSNIDRAEANIIHSTRHSIGVLCQILRDPYVVVLLTTVPVAKLVNPFTELMLQYIPRKFDLSLASASRALSIQAVESLIMLIVILPLVKNITQTRLNVIPVKVDLLIAHYGFLVMTIGCLIMAFAQSLVVFMLGLLAFTSGCSTRPALQSILTDLVGREQITVLYTVIAVGDGIGSTAGALFLNRSLAVAIGWDNKLYLGLPFTIGTVCYIFGLTGSILGGYRVLQRRETA